MQLEFPFAKAMDRRSLAHDFYKSTGWAEGRIADHLKGIDFSKGVQPTMVPKGTRFVQYQIPNAPVGNYFAPIGTPGSKLGIYTGGRNARVFEALEDSIALRSTAAGVVDDWSLPFWRVQTEGGGIQFFVPDPRIFVPVN